MELLIDGKNAFPEILNYIRCARESIRINMFIWRSDTIGHAIAREILAAADRGVRVTITKDRYGVICESCEENMRTLFHRRTSVSEKIKIAALNLLYRNDQKRGADDGGTLLRALISHPNITADFDKNRYDHSKFYLFDDRVLIFGGINIEDKENGRDYSGRRYRDYMIKITDRRQVAEFLQCRRAPETSAGSIFRMNVKVPVRYFGMKEAYLSLIDAAERELTVIMAYFSPIPEFETAILRAVRRGVQVRMLIPESANFQDDLNKKAVSRLVSGSGGKLRAFAFPGMIHAKLLMTEKTISTGSCNITKKAFAQLDELNLFVPNDDSEFAASVRRSVEDTFSESRPLEQKPSFDPIRAVMESLLM